MGLKKLAETLSKNRELTYIETLKHKIPVISAVPLTDCSLFGITNVDILNEEHEG